jgi:steroid 5-alpha reductase family enzyme
MPLGMSGDPTSATGNPAMTTTFIIIGAVIWAYVSAGFVMSVIWQRNDIADVMWGPGILVAALTALMTSGETMRSAPLAYLICGLIFVWAARLAWQIGSRFLAKSQEDSRYASWRKSWSNFYLRSYLQVFLLQGLLMILVSILAIAAAMYRDGATYQTAVVFIGCLVFAFGFAFEAVADVQLNAFVKAKTEKAEILTTGLWRYSRHPNYFGEVTTWWGLWIIAIAPALADRTTENLAIALLALISPITITTLILKISGIPMLEAKYAGNKKFDAYKRRTSAFFPWFPGKQSVCPAPSVEATPQPDQPARSSV